MTHTIVAYDLNEKAVICEGSLEQCAAAMLAAEQADPDGASVEVGHWEGGCLKSLFSSELVHLQKLLK